MFLTGQIDIPDCVAPYHVEPVIITGAVVGALVVIVGTLIALGMYWNRPHR